MMRMKLLIGIFVSLILQAEDFSKLPSWAAPHARSAALETPPSGDPAAWVIFDRTELAYASGNEIWTHRYRLVKVLGDQGLRQGTFSIMGVGGKASRIKRLKGWNLRPDGDLTSIDDDSAVSIEDAGDETFSRTTLTGVVLPRVVKGSWVAFESLQVANLPFGPIDDTRFMERIPIRCWELEAGIRSTWFSSPKSVEIRLEANHLEPLLSKFEVTPHAIRIQGIPALPKDEGGHPDFEDMLPQVVVRFLDRELTDVPIWDTWDSPAKWFGKVYATRSHPAGLPLKGASDLTSIEALWNWMGRELTYKAAYLTPERGWVPEDASSVLRKKFGDCKDLTCLFLGEAQGLGFKGVPALARIVNGRMDPNLKPYNGFNHVISALRLEHSLGLAAEVETPQGHFVLADPTDPLTPFGKLGPAHRGRQVMLCLPEGGLWVAIPKGAIQEPAIQLEIDGSATRSGLLEGTLLIREEGGAWGLRSTALRNGKASLREFLLNRILDLPPNGKLEVMDVSDPLALATPFTLKVAFSHPMGVRWGGGEVALESLGIRAVPPLIQKQGVPRFYPVSRDQEERFQYRARIKVPAKVEAILGSRDVDTSFRKLHWRAEVGPDSEGSQINLALDQEVRPVSYSYPQREQGVQEWKKDRSSVRAVLTDGFAFRVIP